VKLYFISFISLLGVLYYLFHQHFTVCFFTVFLPLGATAQGELWPPEQSASFRLYSSSTGSSCLPYNIYFILEADYLVSQQFNFYGVRLLASRPTPNLEDQGIPLRLAPTP
jgi:hypothetical protein